MGKVVQNIFTEALSPILENSLKQRVSANSMDNPDKINDFILYKNGKMPWVKLQSSVNHSGDVADEASIAQRWVLRSLFTNKEASFIEYQQRNDLEAYNYNTEYGYRPLPGIESVSVSTLQPLGSLRQAVINYKCWTKGQLENLERLYMRPGFSCLLEWGWSYYLDNNNNLKTLTDGVDYFDTKQSERDIINKISQIKESTNFHYDGMIGFVKNFSWKLRPDGGYDCSTTLISKGELISSMTANVSSYALDGGSSKMSKLKSKDNKLGMFTFNTLTNTGLSKSKENEDLDEVPPLIKESDGSEKKSKANYASMLNYQYSKSILSGIFYELAAFSDITNTGIGYQKFSATNSDFPPENPITILSMKMANSYGIEISRKEGSIAEFQFGSNTEKKFIYLKDFIRLINNYAIFHYNQKGKNAIEPIFKILSSRIKSKYHPLVISSNYDVCFVKPSNLILDKIANLAESTSQQTDQTDQEVKNEIKEFTNYLTANFGPGQDYRINDYGDPNQQYKYADSAHILINLHYLYSKINDVLLQNESDSKNDGGINLSSFLSSVLSDISSKLGGLSDLQLIFDDTNGICKIIDRNLLVDLSSTIFSDYKIPIFGEKSIVKNVGVESRIFAEQATMIMIAAQVGGGSQYGFDSTVMGIYDDGLKDRFFTHKDHKLNLKDKKELQQKQEEKREKEFQDMTEAGAKYVDYFLKNLPDDSKTQRPGVILDDSYLKNMLRFVESRNNSNPSAKNARILPINLGLTFDGISGFLIGNILNLENNVIPEPFANRYHTQKKQGTDGEAELYKEYIRDIDYYFAITGIDHSIGTSGWLTNLKTNYVLKNKDPRQGKGVGIQFSIKDQLDKVFKGDIVVMKFGAKTLDQIISENLVAGQKLKPEEKITDLQQKARILYFAELFRDLSSLRINNRGFSKWDIVNIIGNSYTETGGTLDPLKQQVPFKINNGKSFIWSGAGWGLIQFDPNSLRQPLFGSPGIGIDWNIKDKVSKGHNVFDWTITEKGYLKQRDKLFDYKEFQTVRDVIKNFEDLVVYERNGVKSPQSFRCPDELKFLNIIGASNKVYNKYKFKLVDLGFDDQKLRYFTSSIEYLFLLWAVKGNIYNTKKTYDIGSIPDDNTDYHNSYNNITTTFLGVPGKTLAIRNDDLRSKNCQKVRDLISESSQLDNNKLNFGIL